MKLTPKQKKFCEYYIQTGNAAEAARQAGYSEKTACSIGAENLTKPEISAYIAERTASQEKAMVADSDEVMRFYTGVMRGQTRDQPGAALSDRLKAADALMKRYNVAEKAGGSMAVEDDPITAALKEEFQGIGPK